MSVGQESLRAVGDRFPCSVTLVDVALPDQPLIYVNRAFVEMTGYPVEEIIGRNCRFLQGPLTAKADVAKIRDAIAETRAIYCDLLNYRKDGRPFYNRLVLLPLKLGLRAHVIGMQIDASALVAPELEQGRLFDDWKASEILRDQINTPLMKIWAAVDVGSDLPERERILEQAFSQIVATVRSMPPRQ